MAAPNFTTEELESEEWRPVVGYEGLYSASTLGRIRGHITGTILKPWVNKKTGYAYVSPSKDGKRIKLTIHSLVARAFLGPCPKGWTVNHKNGKKIINGVANLEYMTYSDNVQHAYNLGLAASGDRHYTRTQPEKHARGQRSGQSHLTEQQVQDIRARSANGSSYETLAVHFGVRSNSISNIVRRRTWAHVK